MLLLLNRFRVRMHMGVKKRKKEMTQKMYKRVRELIYATHFFLYGGSKTSNRSSSSNMNNSSSSNNNNF